jgi:hypothetical protein
MRSPLSFTLNVVVPTLVQNLDLASNGEALEVLAAIDQNLAQALSARRRLAAQLDGDLVS